jgi:long-chain acyl-CoA synthetase
LKINFNTLDLSKRLEKMNFPWIRSYPENVDWDIKIEQKPLYSILDEAAEKFPDNTAIDFMGNFTNYRKLQQKVEIAAKAFIELGVKKGTKVGIYLPNCPQFIISYYAILKAGGVVVNCSPLYSGAELEHLVKDSGAEIVITLDVKLLYPKLEAILKKDNCLKHIIVGNLPEVLPFPKNTLFKIFKAREIAKVNYGDNIHSWQDFIQKGKNSFIELAPSSAPYDVAVLQYTGGTTGVPKGAILTHENVYSNAVQCKHWVNIEKDGEGSVLCVLPLFHVFAMTTALNLGILTAAKIILHPRFDIKMVLKDLQKKRPTRMPGVPTMYNAINHYKDTPKYDLSSLKICVSGGGPLPVEVKNNFEKITGCKLVEGYGLTESSPVICCNPINGVNKEGSIGLPFPVTEVLIEDMNNKGVFLGPDQKGELCVKGPQVMKGYHNQPEETANVLQDGILRTGDIAYIDSEGYVFIIDRLKEMIIAGGFKIFPRMVEEIIYKHPKVQECAVIGIHDDYSGQRVKAIIVCKKGENCSAEEILPYLQMHLAKHEVPKVIEFVESLPKSPIGKILKKELK